MHLIQHNDDNTQVFYIDLIKSQACLKIPLELAKHSS